MSRPDWARDGLDWPNRSASAFVEAGGLRWHVQVMGEGPPLLLLHGTGAATHSWRGLAPILAQDFLVVAPDLPGHGFTAPLARLATLPAMAAAVARLMERLEVPPALVVGHSAGAAIGARLVLDGHAAPRGLVALNGALLPFPGIARDLFPGLARLLFLNPLTPRMFALQAGLAGNIGKFLARSTGSRIDPQGVELYRRLLSRPGHVAGALEMMASWDLVQLRRDLPRLEVPLTLVAGSNDLAVPATNAREVARLVGAAEVHILTGLGHLAHEEAPADTAAIIRAAAASAGLTRETA
ncbi:MAG: alpha/beta fold hydrolase BchO [Sphingomonadaceae bacterium]